MQSNPIGHHSPVRLKQSKGFSLIELLVALSILAVVTALIVPRFLNVREQAADTTAQAQIKGLNNIYTQWIALGGTPNEDAGLNNIYFLSLVPANGSSTGSRGSVDGCSDTLGNFGSTTISLSGVNVFTKWSGIAIDDEDGFYGELGSSGYIRLKIGYYFWKVEYDPTLSSPYYIDTSSGTNGRYHL